ncbi:MAG: carbohydrate kinase family protein [bacterium]|nr:carbohydrate kinase family protein [bacterium]
MLDLISIGDSTVDVFLEIDPKDAEGTCSLNKERCVICFDYGSKIPVRRLTRIPAVGNAANNAIGSARLGIRVGIYTVLGSDKDAFEIKEVLKEEGVDTEFVVMEKDARSNFSVVINYSAERTIFTYHEERKYDLPTLPKVGWVYFTSVARGHEALHKQIPEYVKNSGAKLAFNPGSYQLREGILGMKPILEITEVLILNREEAHLLVDGDIQDTKNLIRKLRETGPKVVVVTDGRNGSFSSFDGREFWHIGIPEASPIIEMTGAGDAYSTGFLAATISGRDLPEAMVWGTMNATSVVQHIGAREGLLTGNGIEEFIKKYKDQVKVKMF